MVQIVEQLIYLQTIIVGRTCIAIGKCRKRRKDAENGRFTFYLKPIIMKYDLGRWEHR